MMGMNGRSILVAEDDHSIRAGLSDALEQAGYTVLQAADGRQALETLLRQEVDLLLLDVNMPEINGFKLLRMMAKECPGVPCIILTAHGEEKERIKGLELGADDYVVKPFSIGELQARISAVLRRYPGRRRAMGERLTFPGGVLDPETRSLQMNDGSTQELREKEFELFRYLLAHPGRIISQEELLVRVWGNTSSSRQTRTVSVTLTRLREKLDPATAARIENVRGKGYIWKDL